MINKTTIADTTPKVLINHRLLIPLNIAVTSSSRVVLADSNFAEEITIVLV